MNDVLERAALYIKAGLRVLPVNGKIPKISGWQSRAISYEEFSGRFREGDGISVVTGKVNELAVIDIDKKSDGLRWYYENEHKLGNPIKEITPSGGLHLYYRYAENVDKIPSKIGFSRGVDILADGGHQVVTAPSPGVLNDVYKIEHGLTLLDIIFESDDFPDWILAELKDSSFIKGSLESETLQGLEGSFETALSVVRSLPGAVEGQSGDKNTFVAACVGRDYGLTPKETFELLKVEFNPRCVPPWTDKDLKRKVLNAYNYASGAIGNKLAGNDFKEIGQNRKEPERKQKDVLVSKNVKDFCAQILTPKDYIIGPFVRQGLAMVYAPAGVGKTHFCLGLSIAIATGGTFLKWKADKPTSVLYIDGELQAFTLQERLRELTKDIPGSIPFSLLTPDLQPLNVIMPDISTREGQKALNPFIEAAEFIVVDNLSCLARSGNENDAESWIPVQSWALSLRQNGKSILFVHHSGKEASTQRGTSKREDVLDLVIGLSHPVDYDPEQGCVFQVKFKKARHFKEHNDVRAFQANLASGEWRTEDLEEVNAERIEELTQNGCTPAQIAEVLGLHRTTIIRIAKKHEIQLLKTRRGRPTKDFSETLVESQKIPDEKF